MHVIFDNEPVPAAESPIVKGQSSLHMDNHSVTASTPIAGAFWKSVAQLSQCPEDDVPEVAFVGRSNSGKSSALNRIAGARRLARVSKIPGRTQLINLINTSEGGRFVDLPGYGYAKVSRKTQVEWSKIVGGYMAHRGNLVGAVMTMDIRRPLQETDRQFISWAAGAGVPVLVLLSKADKLGRGRGLEVHRKVENELLEGAETRVERFSAVNGTGVDASREWVRARFAHRSQDPFDERGS